MTRIILSGCNGKMGKFITDIVDSRDDCEIVAGVDKDAVMNDKDVLASVKDVEKLIDGKGRVLLRQSGTEPLIRVMVEAETEEKCHEYTDIIVKAIVDGGHQIG